MPGQRQPLRRAAGEPIARWNVTARDLDAGTPFMLASGNGAPPPRSRRSTRRLLRNGSYEIRVQAESSARPGTLTRPRRRGDMKLGDYSTAYADIRRRSGRPGPGAAHLRHQGPPDRRLRPRLAARTLRATAPRPTGGSDRAAGPPTLGFPFTAVRFTTQRPSLRTVTSPGRRRRDLRPRASGLLAAARADYADVRRPARAPGPRRKLEDVDPPVWRWRAARLRGFFERPALRSAPVRADPADGTVMIIDRFGGLQSITDRNGNELVSATRGDIDIDRRGWRSRATAPDASRRS